jgi:hypothetical protein
LYILPLHIQIAYTVNYIYRTHGLYMVRYNKELAVLTTLFDYPGVLVK